MDNIIIDGKLYKINIIIKPTNKYMYMRVKNDNIIITTPNKVTDLYLNNFINKNKDFIIKRNKTNEEISNKIHYLGEEYNIKIDKCTNNNVYIKDKEIIVETKNLSFKYINTLIESFYNKTLENIVEIYNDKIKSDFNIKYDVKFKYKYQKSIFGRCYVKDKIILLSSKLAKYELKYILLIIYHEYAHFKIQNHQKEYYKHIESVYPKYRLEHKNFRKIRYNEMYLK